MMVNIKAGRYRAVLARPYIVRALFATISFRLEPNGSGSRFPFLTNHLYDNHLRASEVAAALGEAAEVEKELKRLSKGSVIWSLDDLRRHDDTGQPVNHAANDTFHYFVSTNGRPLLAVLQEALAYAHSTHSNVCISFPVERLIYPKDFLFVAIGIV